MTVGSAWESGAAPRPAGAVVCAVPESSPGGTLGYCKAHLICPPFRDLCPLLPVLELENCRFIYVVCFLVVSSESDTCFLILATNGSCSIILSSDFYALNFH